MMGLCQAEGIGVLPCASAGPPSAVCCNAPVDLDVQVPRAFILQCLDDVKI
jgi:hypothetical protein